MLIYIIKNYKIKQKWKLGNDEETFYLKFNEMKSKIITIKNMQILCNKNSNEHF